MGAPPRLRSTYGIPLSTDRIKRTLLGACFELEEIRNAAGTYELESSNKDLQKHNVGEMLMTFVKFH